ncbi:MAG: amino acid ABC transporter substrate-binding protein [Oscillospiraceae bacterium]|nr:amino acid ABC transporter substrate-binding protein [Oscillospiraceae bacterium]
MKKVISLVLVALMALTLFTACGEKETETLVMATNAAFPPYEFKEGDSFAGIDIEIAQLIAEKLGKELVIEDVEFGSIITGVQSGKYDMGIAGLTVTDERLTQVNFTTSYATAVQVMIVKNDSAITSIDDCFNYDEEGNPVSLKIENIKIGVQENTTGDIYCSDEVTKWGFGESNVVRYKTGPDAVSALIKGDIDVVVIDNEPAKSFVAANEGIKILETEYAYEDYAIAIAKENEQLLADVNKALAELTEAGEIQKIIDKYIPAE